MIVVRLLINKEHKLKLIIESLKQNGENIFLYLNLSSKELIFKNANPNNYNSIEIYDYTGRKITNNMLDVSNFSKGLYFIIIKKDAITTKVLKCIV
jgi:hypothetical protein